jgi:hypothetical protein
MRDSIKIGPFSAPKEMRFMSTGKSIPGGNTMKFNAFHLIEMKVTKAIDPTKYGFDGIEASAWCVKNKLFSPNIPVKILGNFITGFSNTWSNWELLVDLKRIDTGAWNRIINDPTGRKFRTKDFIQLYTTDPTFKELFDTEAKDAIKTEIIDKHTIVD